VRLVVRTWNVFHGNADPRERHAFLAEIVRLASADGPDVLLLQELPAWSLPRLGEWSGMTAVGEVARRRLFGRLASGGKLARRVTDLDQRLFRSTFTSQANAVLVRSPLRVLAHRHLTLNPWTYRRRFHVGLAGQIAWGRELRGCIVVRVQRRDRTFVVTNLHATTYHDKRLADAELLRAASFIDGFADPGEPLILGGDFNLTVRNSNALPELTGPEWGFEGPTPRGIDHILVRGLQAGAPTRWPDARRRAGGRLLSDHAPVERVIA
jgi:endonuclease/exonuclease/phosphatase family metal-dependent hydrolase